MELSEDKRSKAIVAVGDNTAVTVIPRKVLQEETFVQDLENIIERDFYPDLTKLKAQKEYLEALEKNDVEKLRELHIKFGPRRKDISKTPSIYDTPATFDTPAPALADEVVEEGTSANEKKETASEQTPKQKKKTDAELGLDDYLTKNTSEDNASFADILDETEKKHREKHSWLYRNQDELNERKAAQAILPSIEKQAIEVGSSRVEGWSYVAKNSLMYVPDGSALTQEELREENLKVRVIRHERTRFVEQPFEGRTRERSLPINNVLGKVGLDGKEIVAGQSPRVNGFGMVATPNIEPGVDASPLMTWGEIEGTPFRLDGSGTPRLHQTPGPVFKIPAVPRRDEIALELAEKASKAHRAKKEDALNRVRRLTSPASGFSSRTDRLSSLSPAALKLASSAKLTGSSSNNELRASYTPSPSMSPRGDKTPTSSTRVTKTPTGGGVKTPTPSRVNTPGGQRTPKRPPEKPASITDNLLSLPKRSRAVDYF